MPEESGDDATRIALRFLEGHPEEAVGLLEGFAPRDAAPLLERCAPRSAARLLRCAVPRFAAECLAALAPEQAGAVLEALPLGHAAALLRRLDEASRARLLQASSGASPAALQRVLAHPEGSAGSLMNPRVLSLPADLSVAESALRLRSSSPDDLYYLYVVDRDQKLAGVVTYRQLLIADAEAVLADVMVQPVSSIPAGARGEQLRAHPGWRLYLAMPVVDGDGLLLGAVHRDAILELDRDSQAGASRAAGSAALGVAEMVWLGLSQTLGGLVGPPDLRTAPPPSKRDSDGR